MIERSHNFCFALESRHALRVAREFFGQHFLRRGGLHEPKTWGDFNLAYAFRPEVSGELARHGEGGPKGLGP